MSLTKYDVLPNHSSEADVFCYVIVQPSASQWTFKLIEIPFIPPHCTQTDEVQFSLSAPGRLQSVFSRGFSAGLSSIVKGILFGRKGVKRWELRGGVREHSRSVNRCIIKPVYQSYDNPLQTSLTLSCIEWSFLWWDQSFHLLCLTIR